MTATKPFRVGKWMYVLTRNARTAPRVGPPGTGHSKRFQAAAMCHGVLLRRLVMGGFASPGGRISLLSPRRAEKLTHMSVTIEKPGSSPRHGGSALASWRP